MLQRQVRGCTDTCRQFLRRRQGQSNNNLPYHCDYQYLSIFYQLRESTVDSEISESAHSNRKSEEKELFQTSVSETIRKASLGKAQTALGKNEVGNFFKIWH